MRFAKTAGRRCDRRRHAEHQRRRTTWAGRTTCSFRKRASRSTRPSPCRSRRPGCGTSAGSRSRIGNGTTGERAEPVHRPRAPRPHLRNGTLILGGAANSTSNITSRVGRRRRRQHALHARLGALFDSNLTLNLGGARRDINVAASGFSQNIAADRRPITERTDQQDRRHRYAAAHQRGATASARTKSRR